MEKKYIRKKTDEDRNGIEELRENVKKNLTDLFGELRDFKIEYVGRIGGGRNAESFGDYERVRFSKEYEIEVEKELGLESKEDIEKYGIQEDLLINEHEDGKLVIIDGERRQQIAKKFKHSKDKKKQQIGKEVLVTIKKMSIKQENDIGGTGLKTRV